MAFDSTRTLRGALKPVVLPIPAAAAVVCGTVIFLHDEELTRWMRGAIAVMTYLVALLMVSTFKYWSFKELAFAQRLEEGRVSGGVRDVVVHLSPRPLFEGAV